jgi:C_GCAxxG_C_C family probable redox protein
MSRVESALSRFAEGYNCCQAVLSAYAEQFGLDNQTALKIAAGFGGGMGRMAETCGAVTGAFMVLGLQCGQALPEREAKEAIYCRIREYAQQFRARQGSLLCRELLECDISLPEVAQRARELELFSKTCPQFVRDACEILEEMFQK